MPQIELILSKKAEGRPVTPEEYSVLTQFVDRVERGLIRQRQKERRIDEERELEARASIPAVAFEIPLEDFEVSDRVYAVISEAGYQTVGDLILQMKLDPDAILRLSGMGPKAMRELEAAIEKLTEEARQAEAAAEEQVAEVEEAIAGEPVAEVEGEAAAQPESEEVTVVAEAEAAEKAVSEMPAEEVTPIEEPVAAEEAAAEAIVETEAAAEAIAETEAAAEGIAETEAAAESGAETMAEALAEEEVESLDSLFDISPEVLEIRTYDDEEEEEEEGRGQKKKGKKKKKKYVEMEYDPDKDVVLVKKKRKRGDDWEDNW